MAEIYIPSDKSQITDLIEVQSFLNARGVDYEMWQASFEFDRDASQEEILQAYEHRITPVMKENGYQSADVISVHPEMENIEAIRQKFLSEHTHSEDEVRFFVEGEGKFWFHLENGEVFQTTCHAGDFLSVPAGFKHWFDIAPKYRVMAIRIFSSKEGWVAHYTNSGTEKSYIST